MYENDNEFMDNTNHSGSSQSAYTDRNTDTDHTAQSAGGYTSQNAGAYTSQNADGYTSQNAGAYTSQNADGYTSHSTDGYASQNPGVYSSYNGQSTYSDPQANGAAGFGQAGNRQPSHNGGGWKKTAAAVLCGVLIGAAGLSGYQVYQNQKYSLNTNSGTVDNVDNMETEETEAKEPEISKAEPIDATPTASVSGGIAYDVSDIVENVMPAMVSIINNYTATTTTFWGQTYSQDAAASGSGIIIGENDSEILIATNNHVVESANEITVTFIDDTTATAYIKGTDASMDLAVIAIPLDSLTDETKENIAVASLGNSEELKLGQPVIAIGNALGYGQSVTTGVVSAIDRTITMSDGSTGNFIQTDAAINPGNSGGALLNMRGEVIGINSSKIGSSTVEGMGFAIPISAAEPIIGDLSLQETKIKVDEAQRGFLGITVKNVTETDAEYYNMPQGVYISAMSQGGAAELSGLQVRDIIVKFDTFAISSYADLQNAMQYYAAGTTVPVEVMRLVNGEYESVTVEVTLGQSAQQ